MMTGIRGNRPLDPEFQPEYMLDSCLTIDNQPGIIPVPTFPGVFFVPYMRKGSVVEKFRNPLDFPHFVIHEPSTFCELVIDDSEWHNPEFMPDYATHSVLEKQATIQNVAHSLFTALRLCGFNHFINSVILIGSTLNELHLAEDGSVFVQPFHPISHPMAALHPPKETLTSEEYAEVLQIHSVLYNLLYEADFTPATTALSEYYNDSAPRTKMVIIWSGIECLVKAPMTGLRRGLRSRIAMILGNNDEEKRDIFLRVGKLWASRCAATHGEEFAKIKYSQPESSAFERNTLKHIQDMMESYEFLQSLLWEVIRREKVYSAEELEKMQTDFFEQFPDLDRRKR